MNQFETFSREKPSQSIEIFEKRKEKTTWEWFVFFIGSNLNVSHTSL